MSMSCANCTKFVPLLQPSSSARSARLLQGAGGGFVGFSAVSADLAAGSAAGSGLPGGAFVPLSGLSGAPESSAPGGPGGLVPPGAGDDPDSSSALSGEVRLVLRKMGKRDAVTKLKVGDVCLFSFPILDSTLLSTRTTAW